MTSRRLCFTRRRFNISRYIAKLTYYSKNFLRFERVEFVEDEREL